jgi:hypothetical protein
MRELLEADRKNDVDVAVVGDAAADGGGEAISGSNCEMSSCTSKSVLTGRARVRAGNACFPKSRANKVCNASTGGRAYGNRSCNIRNPTVLPMSPDAKDEPDAEADEGVGGRVSMGRLSRLEEELGPVEPAASAKDAKLGMM